MQQHVIVNPASGMLELTSLTSNQVNSVWCAWCVLIAGHVSVDRFEPDGKIMWMKATRCPHAVGRCVNLLDLIH